MKKAFLILLLTILLCGCEAKKQKILEKAYYNYIEYVNKCSYFEDTKYPFNIDITLERLNDNYLVYRLYIDSPTENLYDIEALVTHNYQTTDVFPSSGLYESPLDLITDANNANYVKGIILSGYIETNKSINNLDITFKALVKVKDKLGYYKEFCYKKVFNSKALSK